MEIQNHEILSFYLLVTQTGGGIDITGADDLVDGAGRVLPRFQL